MKILYISNFYSYRDSSAAVRNNALVKGLLELGHHVDVLTVRYSKEMTSPDLQYGNITFTDLFNWEANAALNAKAQNNKLLTLMRNIYVSIRRYRQFPDRYYRWPSKVDPMKFKDYDLMISSSDGKISHFVGEKIKKVHSNLKWVQIWGDPWYDDLNSNFIDRIRIPFYEKKLLSAADKIVYISKPTAELIKSKYCDMAEKILFVPRSFFNEYHYKVDSSDELHIIYTGTIKTFYGRNLNALIKVIEKWNSNNKTRLYLDIYGTVDEATKEASKSNYVSFYKGVDVSELGDVYKKANALLYISNKSGSTQIPGKLYDYLGTSSMVLCLLNDIKDSIADYLQTLGDKCLLLKNDYEDISASMEVLIEKMQITAPPLSAFSPVGVAKSLMSMI